MKKWGRILAIAAAAAVAPLAAAEPSLERGTVMEAAEQLKPGEYLWMPEVAPKGPVLVVVSLETQRAVVYRNGLPIAVSTVSTGRPSHSTPTGVFTILQRRVRHYSNLYDNAPMPYMQRLTWGGVALHGGHLPGYPASHGCIRLPNSFARLLYGVTQVGMTVVVTNEAVVPLVAPAGALISAWNGEPTPSPEPVWNPQASPSGPISIVVSASDRRAVVLRNGVLIGHSPVTVDGPVSRTSAFILRDDGAAGRSWLRLALPGQRIDPQTPPELRGRIQVPEAFRQSVEAILQPGTTVVVTEDSISNAGTSEDNLIEAEGALAR